MREIKFRAWNKVGKYYVNNVQDAYDGAGPNGPFDSFGDALDNDNYVVEQFTGLYDENGREIYENDILKVTSDDGAFYVATVKWFGDDGYPAFGLEGIPAAWCYDSNALATIFKSSIETCEVIGNRFENPELLEAE